MNLDPLSDAPPPRHVIESDEEDEYDLVDSSPSERNQTVDITIIGDLPTNSKVVFATGSIANYWAQGANLGEQCGGIYANKVQIGFVFRPTWTAATIIISEALSRLPVWAMHDYAQAILDRLKPIRISLLDAYPVHSYVSVERVETLNAPLRYLAVPDPISMSEAEPFSPPNLIQSVSASFLVLLSTSHKPTPGILILVPSLHVPHSLPKIIAPSKFSRLSEDRLEWSINQMNITQRLIFFAVGEQEPPKWEHNENRVKERMSTPSYQLGEGGMYI